MSKKMHPRNIYVTPPNYRDLAKNFPEFRKYVRTDVSGKLSIDFKNPDAVRAFSRTLLWKDFNLDVNIPPYSLVPTVPLRLNYILWIEDLLSLFGTPERAKGIDIGTGASCIYPLLGARKNKWTMIGTDIDANNVKCAAENVAANGLGDLLTVKLVQGNTLLKDILDDNYEQYDFCMCNPPFFGTVHDLSSILKSRKLSRPKPRNAFVATPNEVITKGGEVEFITQLINESVIYNNRIKIFTTMIGIKSNLKLLMKVLEQLGITRLKRTEFGQGRTTRWGLAWTFQDVDLTKVPALPPKKVPKSFGYSCAQFKETFCNLDAKLQEIFDSLHIAHKALQKTANSAIYNIVAYSNTWSHNRRKKREMARLSEAAKVSTEESEPMDCEDSMDSGCSSISKRQLDETDQDRLGLKKFKSTHEENGATSKYLESLVYVRCENECLNIEMVWVDGSAECDSLHQVLQYVKNQLQI